MRKCVIFCAAGFDGLIEPLTGEELVIAADGGLLHTQQLGLSPQIILGDFDSLEYIPTGANVFPVEKDDTDSMLAVRQGLKMGYQEFLLFGCLDGDRLDHTLANFQTLLYLSNRGATGTLVGSRYIVTTICKERLSFSSDFAGILSLFCLGKPARGVTIRGMKYNLENASLTPDFPLGVSNHFLGNPAEVNVSEGDVIAMWDRENGFAERSSCLG